MEKAVMSNKTMTDTKNAARTFVAGRLGPVLHQQRQHPTDRSMRRRVAAMLRMAFRILGMGERRSLGSLGGGASVASALIAMGIANIRTLARAVVGHGDIPRCPLCNRQIAFISPSDRHLAQVRARLGKFSARGAIAAATVGILAAGFTVIGPPRPVYAGTCLQLDAISATSASGTGASVATNCAPFSIAIGGGSGATATNFGVAVGDAATSTGLNSVSVGRQSSATGDYSSAFGQGAKASGLSATALGNSASATAGNGVAIGVSSTASGAGSSVAVGASSSATNNDDSAFGHNATATGGSSTALGAGAQAIGGNSIALGTASKASTSNTLAIGVGAAASGGANALALGTGTTASNQSAVAIGQNAQATALGAIAIGTAGSFGATTKAGGTDSIALGNGATATAQAATALGVSANGAGFNSTAVGAGASAANAGDSALGNGAVASGGSSLAGGANSKALAANAVALGSGSVADSAGAVAIGQTAKATGGKAVSIGVGNTATGDGAVAIGDPDVATGTGAVAMGANNTSNGQGSVALGNFNTATGLGSVALGNTSRASAAGAVALGDTAVANNPNDVALGSKSVTAAAAGTPGATIGGTPYTFAGTTPASTVSIGGVGAERTITNLAAGRLSATSTDAVNGSQLFATNTQLTNNTTAVNNLVGKGGSFASDNSVTPTQAVSSGKNALAGGFGAAATGAASSVLGNQATDNGVANSTLLGQGASIASGMTGSNVAIGQGSAATAAAVPTAGTTIGGTPYTFGGANPAGVVSFGTAGAERQLTNLAAGRLSPTSTDAINGSQLFATNTVVNNVVNGAGIKYFRANSTLADSNAYNPNSIAVGGGAVAGVSGAVTVANGIAIGGNTTATGGNAVAVGANSASSGLNSSSFGFNATASGPTSTAVGYGAIASNTDATALGNQAKATGSQDTAIGVTAAATGGNSTAIGNQATSSGANSTAVGATAVASGGQAAAFGLGAKASGTNSTGLGLGTLASDFATAVGNQSKATGANSFAGGNISNAAANSSVALGDSASVAATAGLGSTAIGYQSSVIGGTGALALGANNTTNGNGALALGSGNSATGQGSVALGNASTASTGGGIALGDTATASASKGAALGAGAIANNANDVALGSNSVTAAANPTSGATIGGTAYTFAGATPTSVVSIGAPGAERQLTNVAAGQLSSTSTDAVNGSQLFATNTQVTNNAAAITNLANGSGVKYFHSNSALPDSVATGANSVSVGPNSIANNANDVALGSNSVTAAANPTSGATIGGTAYTFAGATPTSVVSIGAPGAERQLTNVAAGQLSSTSTDAVNGSQLFATNTQVTNNAAAITNLANGSGVKYFHSNSALPDSVATGADSVSIGPNATANNANDVALGANSVTAAANPTSGATIGGTAYTFAGATPTSVVSIGAPGAERQLTNVAAGHLSSTSTDAVNGSQLFATNTQVTNNAAAITNLANGSGVKYFHSNSALPDSVATGADSVSIGPNAVAINANDVALGSNSVTAAANPTSGATIGGTAYTFAGATPTSVVSIGAPGAERQLTNVAAGHLSSTSTDAVNGSQLFATNSQVTINSAAITNLANGSGVKYFHSNSALPDSVATGADSVSIGPNAIANNANDVALGSNSVTAAAIATPSGVIRGTTYTFAGATPVGTVSVGAAGADRTITNVAAGRIAIDSTDAINGSQLYATNQAVETLNTTFVNITAGGGIRAFHSNSTLADSMATGINSVAIGPTTVSSGANSVGIGNGATATNANDVALGSGSATAAARPTVGTNIQGKDYTFAGATPTSVVSVGAPGAERQITNVAAGYLAADSTDAVNGSQLFATNQAINSFQGTVSDFSGKMETVVQYDLVGGKKTNGMTLIGGDTNAPVVIHNVGPGAANTDAVNVSQLNQTASKTLSQANSYTDDRTDSAIHTANNYTDKKFNQLNSTIGDIRSEARQAAAIGLAAASLRYDDRPGKLSAAIGGGVWKGEGAFAFGVGYTSDNSRLRTNVSGTVAGGSVGVGAGLSYTFN